MPEFRIFRIDSFGGGLNPKADNVAGPHSIQPNQCLRAMNCDFRDGISIQSRDGYIKHNTDLKAYNIVGIYPFYIGSVRHLLIKTWDGVNYELYDGIGSILANPVGINYFHPASYNDYCYIADGTNANKKYDGTDITNMGITAPATAPTVAEGVAGNLAGTYYYYYTYYNNNTGVESGLSPVSDSIEVTDKKITITPTLSSDPQVTHIKVYRYGGDAGPTDTAGTYTINYVGNLDLADTSLGAELITNGGFDSDSWWSKSNHGVIADGVATVTWHPGGSIGGVFSENLLTPGAKYQLKFTVVSLAAPSWVRASTDGPGGYQEISFHLSSTGTYIYNFTAAYVTLRLGMRAYNEIIVSMDDVSLTTTTLTYSDNIADGSLGDEENCSTNLVLDPVKFLAIHHHQMFGGNSVAGPGYIYDSRFYKPEAFPATYYTIIGHAADPIVAMMPHEIDLIIYTRHRMYRYRYIGTSEGDVVLEEIAAIGLSSDNTLVEGTLANGRPCHIFLGHSTRGPGIYLFDGQSVSCISDMVSPYLTGEKEDITSINWGCAGNCCAAMANNKYYLAYPESGFDWPNKVLIADMQTLPPKYTRADFQANAMVYDSYADQLFFGNADKYLYRLSEAHTFGQEINVNYQTSYIGDRSQYNLLKSITFHANTRGEELSVKIWIDFRLEATLTCGSNYMKRIKLSCPANLVGRLFSIEFDISAKKRIKIVPPLCLKVAPYNKY